MNQSVNYVEVIKQVLSNRSNVGQVNDIRR